MQCRHIKSPYLRGLPVNFSSSNTVMTYIMNGGVGEDAILSNPEGSGTCTLEPFLVSFEVWGGIRQQIGQTLMNKTIGMNQTFV